MNSTSMRVSTLALVTIVAAGMALHAQSRPPRVLLRRATDVERVTRWVTAVLQHQTPEHDASVQEIGAWDAETLRQLLIDLESVRRVMRNPKTGTFMTRSRAIPVLLGYSEGQVESLRAAAVSAARAGYRDDDLVLRGVVLHTDIALLETNPGFQFSDGHPLRVHSGADHWQIARALVAAIDSSVGRDVDLRVWYRATLAAMEAADLWNVQHASEALTRFPDDADLLFLAGCLHEMLAAPSVQTWVAGAKPPRGATLPVGSAHEELRRAAPLLKRAMDGNGTFAEARIHYGRVLTLLDRPGDAVAVLRRAAAEVQDPLLHYYAQLFLGAASEAANLPDDARRAYEEAGVLAPGAQSPMLALSQLAVRQSDRGAALRALEPMLALPPGEDDRSDPWWAYFLSPGRSADEAMTEARRRLSTLHGTAL